MDSPSTLLVVRELDVSKEFYLNILGFKIIEESEGGIKFTLGGHNIFMFQGTMESIEYQHGYNANSTLVLTVQNLDEEIKKLKSKGVVFVHESPNQNKWGRYSAFKDPSGIVHELMEYFT